MVWLAVFLFVLALLLIVLEVFLPSAGILTIGAISSMVAAVVLCYRQDPMLGVGAAICGVIAAPGTLFLTVKYWHLSPLGKAICPDPPPVAPGEAIPDRDELTALAGQSGEVVTPLRPVGTCSFNGHRVECVSEWGVVDAGTRVEVTSVQGSQVKVRPLSEA